MWDQLEDAAMETFSISNGFSLCDMFILHAWEGLGLAWRPLGLVANVLDLGERFGFFALEFGMAFFYLGLANFSFGSCILGMLNKPYPPNPRNNIILHRQRAFYFMGPDAVLGRCILRRCDVGKRRDGYGPGSSGNDRQVWDLGKMRLFLCSSSSCVLWSPN